jgi:hypothetical protein
MIEVVGTVVEVGVVVLGTAVAIGAVGVAVGDGALSPHATTNPTIIRIRQTALNFWYIFRRTLNPSQKYSPQRQSVASNLLDKEHKENYEFLAFLVNLAVKINIQSIARN